MPGPRIFTHVVSFVGLSIALVALSAAVPAFSAPCSPTIPRDGASHRSRLALVIDSPFTRTAAIARFVVVTYRDLMANPVSTTQTFDKFTDGSGAYDPDFEDQTAVLGYGLPGGSWDVVSKYRDPQQVKAFYQLYCLGSFVWVWGGELIPGVHLSYQLKDALICYAVATYPGPN